MSLLHSTTIQYPEDPTEDDEEHSLIIKKISDHEIEVDLTGFRHHSKDKKHFIEYISLYSIRRLVDIIYLNPEDEPFVIFDIDKINKKEEEVKRENDDWLPRHWDIKAEYHAVAHCSLHGNWSDVSEEFL